MKQCRFCDADIPYYGGDTCAACAQNADALAKKIRPVLESMKAKILEAKEKRKENE